MVRGRYAPSPTGEIHLGNARTALVAWLSARSQGGTFIWRVEDLDGPRVVPGIEETQLRDLRWLGLDWDAGPDCKQSPLEVEPHHQSGREALYHRALAKLQNTNRLFPCTITRKALRAMASTLEAESRSPYPESFRPQEVPPDWFSNILREKRPSASIRFKVEQGTVHFDDAVFGRITEDVSQTTGDFVVRRRDGLWAYQLAVVVDDADQGITEVVRGSDLLSSTARQVLLQRALGLPTLRYLHVPVLNGSDGEKLSKRNNALSLRSLRETGWGPASVVGELAASLGLIPTPRPLLPQELLESFYVRNLRVQEMQVPESLLGAPPTS